MEVKFYCTNCGAVLKAEVSVGIPGDAIPVKIEPCPDCLSSSRRAGWDEGHETGYSEGLAEADK